MRARLIVAILALVATLPAAAQPCGPFVDVDQDDVFCSDVLWMRNHNVTLGCTATTYCPSENVTRAQMALFMRRLASSMIPAGSGIAQLGDSVSRPTRVAGPALASSMRSSTDRVPSDLGRVITICRTATR